MENPPDRLDVWTKILSLGCRKESLNSRTQDSRRTGIFENCTIEKNAPNSLRGNSKSIVLQYSREDIKDVGI